MTATIEPDPQNTPLHIRVAVRDDCDLILRFIRELADYEKLASEVKATTALLETSLFGEARAAEVVIADWRSEPAGFALFFANYSTFVARRGIFLEDLYVRPRFRGRGIGKAMLAYLAGLVIERDGARLDWHVLDWNQDAIDFYEGLGARKMSDWLAMRVEGDALHALAGKAGRLRT